MLFRAFAGNQKLHSRWGFAGVAYNFCFSIVSLSKKNRILAADPQQNGWVFAFSLRFCSGGTQNSHFFCTDKGCSAFQGWRNFRDGGKTGQPHPRIYMLCCVVKFQGRHSRCGFSGVIYNLYFSSVSLAFKNRFLFCYAIVSPAKKKSILAADPQQNGWVLAFSLQFCSGGTQNSHFFCTDKGYFFFRRFAGNQ